MPFNKRANKMAESNDQGTNPGKGGGNLSWVPFFVSFSDKQKERIRSLKISYNIIVSFRNLIAQHVNILMSMGH